MSLHPVTVHLDEQELAALEKFRAEHRGGCLKLPVSARLLIRDELIGMGYMPLPKVNRSQGARR